MELEVIEPRISPLRNENIQVQQSRWSYGRERIVSLIKQCLPIAQGGAYTAIAVDGCINSFVFGLFALLWDPKREYRGSDNVVILLGVAQLVAGREQMIRLVNRISTDIIGVPFVLSIVMGGVSPLLLNRWITKQIANFDLFAARETANAAQIAVGIGVKAISSLAIGAGMAVITYVAIKGMIAAERAINHPARENHI